MSEEITLSKYGKRMGRPPGSRSKKSAALRKVIAAGRDPLEFLLTVAFDEKQKIGIRVDAAKNALPYLRPRLQSTTIDATIETREPKEKYEIDGMLLEVGLDPVEVFALSSTSAKARH